MTHSNLSTPQVWTALVTPFEKDGGLDWKSFEKLLENQLNSGVRGLVLLGTTGEAPSLSVSEKLEIVKRTKAFTKNKVKLMVGTGSNNTKDSAELSQKVCDVGADSLLVVTPPYNKPSLSGLVKHFDFISKAAKAPICLYHVPGRTAHLLSSEEIREICAVDGVFAVKEASGDLALFSRVIQACPDKLIFSGDDPTYLPSLSVGGHGAISVFTNAFPKAFVALSEAFASCEGEKATRLHRAIFPMIEALFCETNPGPLKAVLGMMGLCQNTVRLPLAPVEENSAKFIKKTLEELKAHLKSDLL